MNLAMNVKGCRVCLNSSSGISLVNTDLESMFEFTTGLTLNDNDSMPQIICEGCIQQMKIAYDFIRLAQASDTSLKEFLLKVKNDFDNVTKKIGSENVNKPLAEEKVHFVVLDEESLTSATAREKLASNDQISTQTRSAPLGQNVIAVKDESKQRGEDPLESLADIYDDGDDDEKQKGNDGYLKEVEAVLDEGMECYDQYIDESSVEEVISYENMSMSQQDTRGTHFGTLGTPFRMERSIQDDFVPDLQSKPPIAELVVCSPRAETTTNCAKPRRRNSSNAANCSFYCTMCNRDFSTKTNLRRHITTQHGSRPFNCPQCGKSFTQNGSLKQHMYIHTGKKPHVCDVCDRGFTQYKSLVFHKRRHTGAKPFTCEVCGVSFRQKDGLKAHLLKHHMQVQMVGCTVVHTCAICMENLSNQSSLKAHMKMHLNNHRNIEKKDSSSATQTSSDKYDGASPNYNGKGELLDDSLSLNTVGQVKLAAAHIVDITASSARVPSRAKKLQCRICFKCFAIRENFVRHLSIHQQIAKPTDMSFNSANVLIEEILEHEILDD